jgi:hypothetical protein
MNEKQFEDILSKYPELIEQGLEFKGRQVKFADLVFEDRHGQTLVVELKIGVVRREHIGQLLDYGGRFIHEGGPPVRVMIIGNRVPRNLRHSLDYHGLEWKEISESVLINHLEKDKDKESLKYLSKADERPKRLVLPKQEREGIKMSSRSGGYLDRLRPAGTYTDFEDLKEHLKNAYETRITMCMDRALLAGATMKQLLEQMAKENERLRSNDFRDIPRIRTHIRYRENHDGWILEYSGDPNDPDCHVRLIGLKKGKR